MKEFFEQLIKRIDAIFSRKFIAFVSVMFALLYAVRYQVIDGKWFVIGLVSNVLIYMSAKIFEEITYTAFTQILQIFLDRKLDTKKEKPNE